jgi:hypothetical protein
MVEDDRVRARRSLIVNGEAGYRIAGGAHLVLDVLNLFDARASNIEYFYRSRLPGEASDGVEDIHTHPVAPRTARVGLRLDF